MKLWEKSATVEAMGMQRGLMLKMSAGVGRENWPWSRITIIKMKWPHFLGGTTNLIVEGRKASQ